MTKCKGSNEDGSVCGRPSMYQSDYCKKHRAQDPSVKICMGKTGSGKPCFREAMTGALFCRGHRTQLGDIEKLQCPRGGGQLTYREDYKNGYYACQKCNSILMDDKCGKMQSTFSKSIKTHYMFCRSKCHFYHFYCTCRATLQPFLLKGSTF